MSVQTAPINDSSILQLLSLFILILVPSVVRFNPAVMPYPPWQTVLIGGIFITICLLGIVAGAAPSSCQSSQPTHAIQSNNQRTTHTPPRIPKKGHHPTCEHFSAHVFQINNRTYCAGCTGLIIGAVISILGSIGYFLLGFPLWYPTILFWFGFIGVALGLLQHSLYDWLKVKRGSIRVAINAIFVIGAFLTLISVDQLTKHLVIDLFLLTAICYWIYTRIMLSKTNHLKICAICGLEPCNRI